MNICRIFHKIQNIFVVSYARKIMGFQLEDTGRFAVCCVVTGELLNMLTATLSFNKKYLEL
jgi:hypothetical protein